jgi:hypothetical protein
MGDDNPSPIPPGGDVAFPHTKVSSGGIVKSTDTQFILPTPGAYWVSFVTSAGGHAQLVVTLNNAEDHTTVFGRNTAGHIVGTCIVIATTTPTVLTIRVPSVNNNAVHLQPDDGGNLPVSANLVIVRLS